MTLNVHLYSTGNIVYCLYVLKLDGTRYNREKVDVIKKSCQCEQNTREEGKVETEIEIGFRLIRIVDEEEKEEKQKVR